MKKFNPKVLSIMVSTLMTLSVISASSLTQSSDIEIYKIPVPSETVIVLMLDTSGSMDSLTASSATSTCDLPAGVTLKGSMQSDTFSFTINGKSYSYGRRYCEDTNNKKYYDRISRLQDALYAIATSEKIPTPTKIAIGTFPYIGSGDDTNLRGQIRIPAAEWGPLGSSQRIKLIELITNKDSKGADTFKGSGGTPTSSAYAEAVAYLLGTTTGGGTYSGFSQSASDTKETVVVTPAANGKPAVTKVVYKSPLEKRLDPMCSGKGVYFLTDGSPQTEPKSETDLLMNQALQVADKTFNYTATPILTSQGQYDSTTFKSDWGHIGNFSKIIQENIGSFFVDEDPGHRIITAVVGFGSMFQTSTINKVTFTNPYTKLPHTYYNCEDIGYGGDKSATNDARSACNWGAKSLPDKLPEGVDDPRKKVNWKAGGYGEGGFYSASSTTDIVNSLISVIMDLEPKFEPLVTGTPTIPTDSLNPMQYQPYGYYANFLPKPQEKYQLWLGDLNKYHVYNGQLYGKNKTTRVITDAGELDQEVKGLWASSFKNGLKLSDVNNVSQRKVFTNRKISLKDSKYVAEADKTLQAVNLNSLGVVATASGALKDDPNKNHWLNVLGYGVSVAGTHSLSSLSGTAERRQVGAILHSAPILLTQEGVIGSDSAGHVTTTGREDYVLFGTTQGMLHVADAETGEEKLVFVPHEMMELQNKGFLYEGATDESRQNLYYGIDGTWTAHTRYVSTKDGTFTVKEKGAQWVYGGLRMGGRSYYALDLTDIDKPKLKFHIDPANQKIYKEKEIISVSALQHMGQSWSKPTLTWIRWDGERKLVMLVGGGYDGGYDKANKLYTGYEKHDYVQANGVGGGVYMFDAENGDLLWWASSKAKTTTLPSTGKPPIPIGFEAADLKYSVVSQINAIDRDGDGLSDVLYFGDLGGQAFRVDLDNNASDVTAFSKRVAALYKDSTTGGVQPRFYEMPNFSVHKNENEDGGFFGTVVFNSGNRSSPLAGKRKAYNNFGQEITTSNNNTVSATDALFTIFDNDVARANLYTLRDQDLRTKTALSLPALDLSKGVAQMSSATDYNSGWKYTYSTDAGKYKGMGEMYAIDGMLYANVYNKDAKGFNGDCNSGVVGATELFQFCLPSGKCKFYDTQVKEPKSVRVGAGIVGASLGYGLQNDSQKISLAIKRPDTLNCNDLTNKNNPECQEFENKGQLKRLRWYEYRVGDL